MTAYVSRSKPAIKSSTSGVANRWKDGPLYLLRWPSPSRLATNQTRVREIGVIRAQGNFQIMIRTSKHLMFKPAHLTASRLSVLHPKSQGPIPSLSPTVVPPQVEQHQHLRTSFSCGCSRYPMPGRSPNPTSISPHEFAWMWPELELGVGGWLVVDSNGCGRRGNVNLRC